MPKFFSSNLRAAKTGPALRYRIEDENGEPIAITFGQATQEGDAVLFSKAPEMYMLLNEISRQLKDFYDSVYEVLGESNIDGCRNLAPLEKRARKLLAEIEGA